MCVIFNAERQIKKMLPCADVCLTACGKGIQGVPEKCVVNDDVYNTVAEYDKTGRFVQGTLKFYSDESYFTEKDCSDVGGVECKYPDGVLFGGCDGTRFGCCPDKRTAATGPDQEGCASRNPCAQRTLHPYGCCRDGITPAKGPGFDGCSVGGCESTRYGCCPGEKIPAKWDMSNCSKKVGCSLTEFGCCPDGITTKQSMYGAGCNAVTTGGCQGTEFGCCPTADGNMTPATYDPATGVKVCPGIVELIPDELVRYCPDGSKTNDFYGCYVSGTSAFPQNGNVSCANSSPARMRPFTREEWSSQPQSRGQDFMIVNAISYNSFANRLSTGYVTGLL